MDKVARRYARALFELCSPDEYENVRDGLLAFANLYTANPELQLALQNPAYPVSQRAESAEELVSKISGGRGNLSRLVALLISNGRVRMIADVAQAFKNIIENFKKLVSVEISSAFELPEVEKNKYRDLLKSQAGNLSSIEWKVQPELIGGFVVRCGDRLVDRSLRGAINNLKESLTV